MTKKMVVKGYIIEPNANLSGVNLSNTDLNDANLTGADLKEAIWYSL